MESILLKYLDCSTNRMKGKLESMKKYLKFSYLKKSLHSITHREAVKFKDLIN